MVDPLRIFGLLDKGDLTPEATPNLGRAKPTLPAVKVGALLDGRFRVLGQLGGGAFGAVFKATDESLSRDVAIKLLHRSTAEARTRFEREAESTARLRHPNVLTVFEVGEASGHPYIVYELVEGAQDLAEAFSTRGLEERLDCFEQTLAGVAAAHEKGIVHRDLKPENILVRPSGQVLVADFGLARVQHSDLTASGAFLGTPFYMAPEQVTGEQVSPAADVWSLGLILYEALYDRSWTLRDEETLPGLLARILEDSLERPPGGPSAVAALLFERVLVRDPRARIPDAGAFLRGLREARSAPGSIRVLRSPWSALAASIPVVALMGATAWVVSAPRSEPPTAAVPAAAPPTIELPNAASPNEEQAQRAKLTTEALKSMALPGAQATVLRLLCELAKTGEPSGSEDEADLVANGVRLATAHLDTTPERAADLLDALADTGILLTDCRAGARFMAAAHLKVQFGLPDALYWRYTLAACRLDFPIDGPYLRSRHRTLRPDTRPWDAQDKDPWKQYLNLRMHSEGSQGPGGMQRPTRRSYQALLEFLLTKDARGRLGPWQWSDSVARVVPVADPNTARGLLEQAERLTPNNPLVHDAWAFVLSEAGDLEAALERAERADKLFPLRAEREIASGSLGRVLQRRMLLEARLGYRTEAAKTFRRLQPIGAEEAKAAATQYPWLKD